MAITLAGATNRLDLTSNLLSYNTDYTLMFWYRLNTDANQVSSIVSLDLDPAGIGDNERHDQIKLSSTGTVLRSLRKNNSEEIVGTGTDITVSTWYHIALIGTSTTLTLYLNSVSDAVATTGRVRNANTNIRFNRSLATSDNYQNMSLYAAKAWTRALTTTEIAAERLIVQPVSTTNLYAYWPFETATTVTEDASGLGHAWTLTGAASTVTNPSGVSYLSPKGSTASIVRAIKKKKGY